MMNSTERIRAMIDKRPFDRIGVSGWVHMPFVDHNVHDMVKATVMMTDYCGWDFVKIMCTGHYIPEAYGAEITLSKDPAHWYGTIHRYPVTDLEELKNMPVLDKDNWVFEREVAVAKALVEHYRGTKPIIATVFTPLTCLQETMERGTHDKTTLFMKNHSAEMHEALRKMVETNKNYLDALIDEAGIDGIFFANQYASRNIISDELYDEFCEPYDRQILDHIRERTWFNILHIHGENNLMFDKCLDYDVQAYSWENCVPGLESDTVSTVADVRKLTDRILITGLARHYDYYNEDNNRNELKEFFRKRLLTVIRESADKRVVFAPGCALPMDVDRYVFTLMKEVVEEEGYL